MPFIKHEPPSPQESCRSIDHNPPMHIVLQPGTHVWQCPACGTTQDVHVPSIRYTGAGIPLTYFGSQATLGRFGSQVLDSMDDKVHNSLS